MKKAAGKVLSRVFPQYWKKYAELNYWKRKKESEGKLTNEHYRYFYTTHFGLKNRDYHGKRILDIGCGPRGSLEWADMAKQRVGLDPLANEYLKLGADIHKMEYVAAPSEQIPFQNSYFDIVSAYNSLDHVTNLGDTIREIKRVTKHGGLFLLLVEINHEPTNCEPHMLTMDIISEFEPEFKPMEVYVYKPVEAGLYASIKRGEIVSEPEGWSDDAWLSVKFKSSSKD